MCGIHGIYRHDQARIEPGLIARMADRMVHRGPDDVGAFFDHPCAIGMRRLSIIDLAGGHQPIANAARTTWVVCNGEIYNYRELQQEIRQAGIGLRTNSDTEVIVHLYDLHGPAFVERLNGMFAFAIWDARRRRLLLGRDRLGIKPLYLLTHPGMTAFASEAKALLALPGVSREVEPGALIDYLSYGYVGGPASMLRGIRKLAPATLMSIDAGGVRENVYWRVPTEVDHGPDRAHWVAAVREQVAASVRSQMVSDVPVGAFLSGGIDSSAVVAHMAAQQRAHSPAPIRTFSIGFEGGRAERLYNELPQARSTARHFGTHHREIIVRPDILRLVPQLLAQLDEPVADSAFITTALIAQFACQDVKVILSGVGGDELFGGYRRYLGPHYRQIVNRLPLPVQGALRWLADAAPADRHHRAFNLIRLARGLLDGDPHSADNQYRGFVRLLSDASLDDLLRRRSGESARMTDRIDPLDAAFLGAGNHDHCNRLLAVDAATQLPDDLLMLTDRMTMASSIECRVPLLDHQLVELAARIPTAHKIRGGQLKSILREAVAGTVPRSILHQRKRGFGAPVGAWIKRELSAPVARLLDPAVVQQRGWFDPGAVQRLLVAHQSGRIDGTDSLMALVNLEIWSRLVLDGHSVDDVATELGEAGQLAAEGTPVRFGAVTEA